jgi:DNA topoisomerase-3
VEKVRGSLGKEVHGEFKPLPVPCPRCGAPEMKETFRAFECPSCKMIVWKMMAGREFEREEVATLLREGRVGPIEGFRSKLGRPFTATVTFGEDGKQKFDFEQDEANADGTSGPAITNPEPLGRCPVCKEGQVFETANSYQCEKVATKNCTFRMGRTILQREIPRDQAARLVQTGKTALLPRFISKKGKPFSAYLVLGENGKVGFEFEPRAPKKKGAKPERASSGGSDAQSKSEAA